MKNNFFNNFKIPLLFSIFFTLSIVLGNSIDTIFTIFKARNIFSFFILFPFIFIISSLIINNTEKITDKISKIKNLNSIENIFLKPTKKCYRNCFILISIPACYALMAHFPGIVAYDFIFQIGFFELDSHYIEVHPILHNLIMYAIYLLNKNFNSPYIGTFIHSIFQSTIMISIFSYCVYFLAKHKINPVIKLFTLLYFAFYPIHHILMITTTKDVIFAGLVLLFSIELLDFSFKQKEFLENKFRTSAFILIIFLLFCFRHNAIWAYILALPFILFFFKKNLKKVLIIFILPILFFTFFGQIKKICGIKKGPNASFLSIPLQQMGRVRLKYNGKLNEKDVLTFRNIVSEDCELKYNPHSVDSIKIDTYENLMEIQTSRYIENATKNNLQDFYNLYFKWLKEYPLDYIDAFIATNYYNWYIGAKYEKLYHSLGQEPSSLFLINKNHAGRFLDIEMSSKCLNPFVKLYYNSLFIRNNFEHNLFLFIIFSFACNLWFLILNFCMLLKTKKYKYLILFVFPFCLIISVLFGPTSLLRYVYYNYLILPIALAFNLKKSKTD